MTTDPEQNAAFNRWADTPRRGWTDIAGSHETIEFWTREAAGFVGTVTGLTNGERGAAGYWRFMVKHGDEVIAEGESSRRGFAMDGADELIPTLN